MGDSCQGSQIHDLSFKFFITHSRFTPPPPPSLLPSFSPRSPIFLSPLPSSLPPSLFLSFPSPPSQATRCLVRCGLTSLSWLLPEKNLKAFKEILEVVVLVYLSVVVKRNFAKKLRENKEKTWSLVSDLKRSVDVGAGKLKKQYMQSGDSRVIKIKVPLQPHQKYHITPYEELGFS